MSEAELLAFAIAQWRLDVAMEVEDAYKWLFHAVLGGEHAISDLDGVRRWMDREWASLGPPQANEPMTVSLEPFGRLIRVNLRPYQAAGGSKEALLAVFVESARKFRGDKSVFVREWQALGAILRSEPIGPLTESEWLRLDRLMNREYPAIEHSDRYLKQRDPAYRVVEAKLWAPLEEQLRRSPPGAGL